jgi:hypothetical protein
MHTTSTTTRTRKTAAITLQERPERRAICETQMRYDVLLHGNVVGELYFNMRGYVGVGLPLPGGGSLSIGEQGIAGVRREIAKVNREWAAAAVLPKTP